MDPISTLNAINGVAGVINTVNSANDSDRQQQYQLELMREQQKANRAGMRDQISGQKEMYEYTGYESKVRQMKAAGLNPALIYGMGGSAGGTTANVAAPTVSQGSAPNVAQSTSNKTQQIGMALQMAKMQSEIELNKSAAQKNIAEAGTSGVNTETGTFNLGISKETRQHEITKRGGEAGKVTEEAFGKKIENDIRSQSMSSEIEARNQLGTEANLKVQQQIKELAFTDAKIALTESQQTEVVNRAVKLAIESRQIGRDYQQRQQAIEVGVTNFMMEMGMKKQFHSDEQFNEVARNVSHVASMAIGGAMIKGGK